MGFVEAYFVNSGGDDDGESSDSSTTETDTEDDESDPDMPEPEEPERPLVEVVILANVDNTIVTKNNYKSSVSCFAEEKNIKY